MKSLSEVADVYEEWAKENEARAEEILAREDCYAYEVREHQILRAGQLMADAAALKKRAAELRKLEAGIPEELHAVSRTPSDQACDRPRTIINRFRNPRT
jgi:hypothetical protein